MKSSPESTSIPAAFPAKLHHMLRAEATDVCSWGANGSSFSITDTEKFASEVLPKYFRHSKLTSFQRQLNLYGFRRLTKGPDAGAYVHPRFLRDRPELVSTIKRSTNKSNGGNASAAAAVAAAAAAVAAPAPAAMQAAFSPVFNPFGLAAAQLQAQAAAAATAAAAAATTSASTDANAASASSTVTPAAASGAGGPLTPRATASDLSSLLIGSHMPAGLAAAGLMPSPRSAFGSPRPGATRAFPPPLPAGIEQADAAQFQKMQLQWFYASQLLAQCETYFQQFAQHQQRQQTSKRRTPSPSEPEAKKVKVEGSSSPASAPTSPSTVPPTPRAPAAGATKTEVTTQQSVLAQAASLVASPPPSPVLLKKSDLPERYVPRGMAKARRNMDARSRSPSPDPPKSPSVTAPATVDTAPRQVPMVSPSSSDDSGGNSPKLAPLALPLAPVPGAKTPSSVRDVSPDVFGSAAFLSQMACVASAAQKIKPVKVPGTPIAPAPLSPQPPQTSQKPAQQQHIVVATSIV